MMTQFSARLLVTSAMALAMCAVPAIAQSADTATDAPVSPAAEAQIQTSDGDIVVTARRRSEGLITVPVVVSVQTALDLKRYNASDLSSIGQLTPSIVIGTYGANGGSSIAIRGISSPANQSGFEQAVSVAVDGVQTSNGHIAQLGFFDLAQSEVLKGPQALLFGKNNTAGVISITTADPTPDWQVKGQVGYEFVGDEVAAEGSVSGPLSNALGVRVAVRYSNLDGWLRNTARPIANPFYKPATGAPIGASMLPGTNNPRPGKEELLGRVTLTFSPDNSFHAKLKVFGAESDDAGPGVQLQNIGPCTGGLPRVSGIADPFGDCVADNRVSAGDVPTAVTASYPGFGPSGINQGHLRAYTGVLAMDKDITDTLSLNSTTGYNHVKYEWFSGLDHTTYSQLAQFEHTDESAFSQELRLSSQFKGPINFMLGGYYSRTTYNVLYDVTLNTGNYQASTGRFESFEKTARQKGETLSAFAQARWNIIPEIELAGGVRWSQETKRQSQYNLYGIGGFATQNTVFATSIDKTPGILASRFRDDNLSPEVTLTWHPDADRTIFAAYRTGFKAGGFGLTNPLSVASTVAGIDFESEKARGFEVGAKGYFADRRLRLSVAAFNYTFTNLQVNTYDPATISYFINNAGRVKQHGAELDANFRANEVVTLHGALSYVSDKFHNYIGQCYSYAFPTGSTRATATPPPNCSFANNTTLALQQNFEGRTPARAPKWSGNIGAVVNLPIGESRVELTGDGQYTSSYYAADTLAEASKQRSYWLLNSSVSFVAPDDRWKLSLIGKNLSNKYIIGYAADRTGGASVPGAIGEQRGAIQRGREITLQAAVSF